MSRASWAEVKQAVEAALGPVDVLCNNAGIALPFQPLETVSEDLFDRVMAINVKGVFLGCQAFMSGMKARRHGHIVNTSSVNGFMPFGSFTTYCASKFAVAGFSEALVQELAPAGVGVSIRYPGLTRSRMSQGQVPEMPDDRRAALEAQMMDPLWLGRAVVRAVEDNRLHIITHPDTKDALVAPQQA
ncbi:MAG TPA: SDR family oxidoreductase, partial [Novosphingobium sp.]|nr:SDR family oxidoreductase [Novosphingobium sp.]